MEQEKKAQPRKGRAANGQRDQKMMSFRLDSENAAWLERQPNKGRYINDLLAQARNQAKEEYRKLQQ